MNNSKFSFHKVSECKVKDNCNHKLYLTFDIDWACDEVLLDTIELVEHFGVAATWFVTHDTPLLERLRGNTKFELGLHPNFNSLLEGNCEVGLNAEKIIEDILKVVPEAKSVRSHSLTQNSRLQEIFIEKGLTHECNNLIPEQSNIILQPWKLWNGLLKVPHFWEDDAVCIYRNNTSITELLHRNGLKVFDFHPIHVFLNTESLSRYDETRQWHKSTSKLINHRYSGHGTRSKLLQLLEASK